MSTSTLLLGAPDFDAHTDEIIKECLNPDKPQSFFLYAGAGSGKTRSLKNALEFLRDTYGSRFLLKGQKIAVITYTNAACDEISQRVLQNPLFKITTIHSFCWDLIEVLHRDIQEWLLIEIPKEIAELEEQQAKGRAGSKAAADREKSIAAKQKRLEWLKVPRKFTYSPNGDNFGNAALAHDEVIKIASDFIANKPSMQAFIVNRFPFLLIDESQDTHKRLIDAVFALESANRGHFAVGLFGDTMQRIYADGKPDLGKIVPTHWSKPMKEMNHRSPQRIIRLGNAIRAPFDGRAQRALQSSNEGFVRFFASPSTNPNKVAFEDHVRSEMAKITGDKGWIEGDVKILTLEHHMAAARMHFSEMYAALDKDPRNNQGLRNGQLAGVRFFSERVMPLIEAVKKKDDFTVITLLRKHSPLLKKETRNLPGTIAHLQTAVGQLAKLDSDSKELTFGTVLERVSKFGLFDIPNSLKPFAVATEETNEPDNEESEPEDTNTNEQSASLEAWRTFLSTPYRQIKPYAEYVADQARFGTHQGVKGREFDRVMVIIDSDEEKGFMFDYEKLFGAKPLTSNDLAKKASGEETGMDRTRKLLYVTCTRAMKSLVLVAYTNDPMTVALSAQKQGWFDVSEIVVE